MTQQMKYTVFIRQVPDGTFVAACPLIPEALAQGETYEECLANVKEALDLSLEFRRERGEEVPSETATTRVTVTV
jgi:antitoxin HicB